MKQKNRAKQDKANQEEREGLARLRAEVQGGHEASHARGATAGHDWALKEAGANELARLQQAVGRRRVEAYAGSVAADPRGAATRLYADLTGVRPGEEIDPADVTAFWGRFEDDLFDGTAVAAFVTAALAVWAKAPT